MRKHSDKESRPFLFPTFLSFNMLAKQIRRQKGNMTPPLSRPREREGLKVRLKVRV
jgi:hypothetical protein